MIKVATIFGTRPEAIKLAPVIKEMVRSENIDPIVIVTGQHREMLDQALGVFDIVPDIDLDLMEKGNGLIENTSSFIKSIGSRISELDIDYIVVQGDTTSAFIASLVAFYLKIPVGHVEAGLRSHDKEQPFPEEINRRLISVIADHHFAPTELSKANLIDEGVSPDEIFLTGNPIIDSLEMVLESEEDNPDDLGLDLGNGRSWILVTAHRRENWGKPLEDICRTINDIVKTNKNVEVIFPVHLNPTVKAEVDLTISDDPRIHLDSPLKYSTFMRIMSQTSLILTDSGGIQEEAVSLNKDVLVMRDVTERKEAVAIGAAELVGSDPVVIAEAVDRLLGKPDKERSMSEIKNPFGDGKAAKRIVSIITEYGSKDRTRDLDQEDLLERMV